MDTMTDPKVKLKRLLEHKIDIEHAARDLLEAAKPHRQRSIAMARAYKRLKDVLSKEA